MIKSNCKKCGKEITKRGSKSAVFCSLNCKSEWQMTQKPVSKEWLYEKYIIEGMGTYQISKIVNRNPKRIWEWLKGYGIAIRERDWDVTPTEGILYQNESWLRNEYLTNKRSAPEIASQFGVTFATIFFYLNKFNIPVRSISEARKIKHWGISGKDNPMFGRTGKSNPRWNGGATPERQSFYASIEWADTVKAIWKRDKGTCQKCGLKKDNNTQFHIHHIVSFKVTELRTNHENLILLCKPCHNFVHSLANVDKVFIKTINDTE